MKVGQLGIVVTYLASMICLLQENFELKKM